MKSKAQPLTEDMIEVVARRFRLLAEPVRLRLLRTLESGEYTVNELADAVHSTQANVSRHLSAMSDAGLLHRRRKGNSICYSIGDPIVFKLCELVCESVRERAREQFGALTRTAGQR